MSRPDPITVGWQVLDPDGNVVSSGDVTIVEADLLEEIATFIADAATYHHTEGVTPWQG